MKEIKSFQIKNPCNERWEDMAGDERSRSCEICEKRVYNLTSMSARELEELDAANEGGFCGRYLAGPDGLPILRSSPRRSFLRRIAAVLAIFVPALASACRDDPEEEEETTERLGNGNFESALMGFFE